MGNFEEKSRVVTNICDENICTSCGACTNVCPKNCIVKNTTKSTIYMSKGVECINCKLCQKVCPQLSENEFFLPTKAYAGWANDIGIRNKSASGGIATSLYLHYLKKGAYIAGAEIDEKFDCFFSVTNKIGSVEKFQNSKYTFSNMGDCYLKIIRIIKRGERCCFIGLPCQVAALRQFLKNSSVSSDNILFVDLICHGTPLPNYIKEHKKYIEKKCNTYFTNISFRDNTYGTGSFVLSLYNHAGIKYSKKVMSTDAFQVGYHQGLIYRDCCYNCKYAQQKRVGDLTIADYSGLGADIPFEYSKKNVSLILVNTDKGNDVIKELSKEEITIHERPLSEPFKYETQLKHPTLQKVERKLFIDEYENGNFTYAADYAFRKIYRLNRLFVRMCGIDNRSKAA